MRPNGRLSGSFVVKESGRKPLFSSTGSRGDEATKPRDKENDRTQLGSTRNRLSMLSEANLRRSASFEPQPKTLTRRSSTSSLGSTSGSRIPRPSSIILSNRKQLSLKEAMNRAALEMDDESDRSHVMDASPSPAPRIARSRREEEDKRMRKILGQDHLDTKAPARPFSRQSLASSPLTEARPSPGKQDSPRRRSLYGKPRAGLGHLEPSQDGKSPKLNGPQLEGHSQPITKDRLEVPFSKLPPTLKHLPSKDDLTNQGRIPALAPGIEDLPWPSVEKDEQHQPINAPPPTKNVSPEKSFGWEFDQDLAAGDLQISDSPRIRIGARPFADRIKFDENSEVDINSHTRVANPGSRNTKLDEIRIREVKAGSNIPIQSPRRQPNTKLADIQKREAQAEHQIPIPDRRLPKPSNTKLDEIRQREINGIPNRALAKMKLDEIREKNSYSTSPPLSRSLSPEESRPISNHAASVATDLGNKILARPKSAFEVGGERVPDTPVTIFKSQELRSQLPAGDGAEATQGKDDVINAKPMISHRRSDSRDLLRQLARAASSSPAPETEAQRTVNPPLVQKPVTQESNATLDIPQPVTRLEPKTSHSENPKHGETSKPTVGFIGIPRSRSTDSVKSKRSSMQSEVDPTDRIEAEAKLFALGENQSEKGSVRAPSPELEPEDEKEIEATPRPPKPDPLTMPTPKISGAYVETPATVKVEKINMAEEGSRDGAETKPLRPRSSSANNRFATDFPRNDFTKPSSEPDTASDPGTDEKSAPIGLSTGVRRRRAHSLPRRRGPLRNSAKLPTVKDDLMQLHRVHQIEDSTLDDLDQVLSGRKTPSPRMKALLNNLPTDTSLDDDFDFDLELDTRLNTKSNQVNNKDPDHSDGELAAYSRMTKSLQTGLMGIRTAKKGIERLEDQFALDTKSEPTSPEKPSVSEKEMKTTDQKCSHAAPISDDDNKAGNYFKLPVPIPHLYRRKPSFRLTFLGFLVLTLSLWYAAESAMCAVYCRPASCGKTTNCVWSIDDPSWGNAIPVKLDQWTTGGQGRVLFNEMMVQLDDWTEDLWDMYYDRDITNIDISDYTFEQKRQHRRRLRKKGLVATQPSSADQQAKWDAWHKARLDKERAQEAREMGYDVFEDDDGAIGGDERVW
ncbi:hypothetical protein BGZ63DRAFT_362197 [Mariannaea sp. PMI_226]|nr:hypothetical protein BGZ63DRAFT_362197 [Mariannaea sp. PMI_226]